MTRRKRLNPKQRGELLDRHNGCCHICAMPIKRGERWEVSHPIPLELGGPDDDSNRAPAHYKCHKWHTAMVDLPAIAKAKRIVNRERDLYRPRRPMPGGRDSPFKFQIGSTTPIDRVTGLPWRGAQ